jgi:hypothetical protein
MADLATLQNRLGEAEAAYHRLATGSQLEEVWIDGTRTRYTPSDASKLSTYISGLQAEIGSQTGRRRSRLIRMVL